MPTCQCAVCAQDPEGVGDFEYILLTHWHPDRVDGLRTPQSRATTAGYEPSAPSLTVTCAGRSTFPPIS